MRVPSWIPDTSRVVLEDSRSAPWCGADLVSQVRAITCDLQERKTPPRVVGLLADNSLDWVAVDLATHGTAIALVPLPDFFTPSQLRHIVALTGIELLFCADAQRARALGFERQSPNPSGLLTFERSDDIHPGSSPSSEAIQKITFTSGTTGCPKGVCLTADQQLATARALAAEIAPLGIARHLSLLPLPVLLENVAGLYAGLLIGATCICPPLATVGLAGASRFDAERCLRAIDDFAPDSVILLPQMLQALVSRLERGAGAAQRIRSLKFVAVGGARTPVWLIHRARALGMPVYEGYGLSECASVVTLNRPGADKPGSVGRALPGLQLRIAEDGELQVAGRRFCGYLGSPRDTSDMWLSTGDIATCDADGFVSVTGRKKNILITSFGRNVSPEWPEHLLLESRSIVQATVFGEARPHLVAVLVSAPGANNDTLERAVMEANRQLPAYAHIRGWIRASEPFTDGNALATANGRIRRDAVWSRYGPQLNQLYMTESHPHDLF